MAKPAITLKSVKGSPLSTQELDTNFTNLQNSTITVRANNTDVVTDLNGTVTLVAGDNVTLTADNTAKTVTITTVGGLGEPGPEGPPGPTGPTGPTGFTGSQGVAGFIGSRGFTGSQGSIGFTGSQGSITIQNDTSSNAGRFLLFTDVSSGTKNTLNTSDSKITFNPLTGRLTTTELTSNFTGYREKIFNLGTVSGIVSPDVSNGNIQTMTLSGNISINSLNNVQEGQSITLIIRQDSVGGRVLTSNMLFANGALGSAKSLSTTPNSTDVLHIFYDGTVYLASLIKGYV